MSTFSQVWHWYIAGAIMGFFSAPVHFVFPPIILSNWFEKKRGFVIGVAVSFSGIGGAVINPILASIIQSHGWRFAYVANAIIAGVIVLPFLIFVLRLRPADKGLKPYGYEEKEVLPAGDGSAAADTLKTQIKGATREDAVRSYSFIIMLILFATLGLYSGYPPHLTSYGINIGLSASLASLLLSLSMIGNASSKVLLGFINDKFGGKAMISTSFCMILFSLILLLIGGRYLPPLFAGSLLAGSLYAASSVSGPLLAQTVYGTRDFARILILLSMSSNLFVSFGPTIVGYIYDFSGGYSLPFIVGIIVVVTASCLAYVSIKNSKKLNWS